MANNTFQTPLRYPTSDFFKNNVSVVFTLLREETKEDGTVATTTRGTRAVNLYIPKAGFQVTDSAEYSGGGVGSIGKFIIDSNASAGEQAVSVFKDFSESISDAVLFATGTGNVTDANTAVVAKLLQRTRLQDSQVGRAVRSKFGVTANPHLRSVFEQVNLRSFGFDFELIPNSREEAQVIKKIVRFFRESLYPETIGVEDAPDIAYKFPTKFDIAYYFRGKRIAHRIKPCFLTQVKTNYNAQGQGMYYDGEFLSTKIELSFQEETTLSKKDVMLDVPEGIFAEQDVGF